MTDEIATRLAAHVSVAELIPLALEDLGRLPIPHKSLRAFLSERYGREIDPQAIAATRSSRSHAGNVPTSWRRPCVRTGSAAGSVRPLYDRIVPYRADFAAMRRVNAATSGRPLHQWDGACNNAINAAVKTLQQQPLRRQIFGVN
ncbi:MAG: hypothetical protein ACXWIS_10310 [Burkholderiales bacterium]